MNTRNTTLFKGTNYIHYPTTFFKIFQIIFRTIQSLTSVSKYPMYIYAFLNKAVVKLHWWLKWLKWGKYNTHLKSMYTFHGQCSYQSQTVALPPMSTPRAFLLQRRRRSWDSFNPENTWRPASATHPHMGTEYQPCSWSDLLFLEPYVPHAASLHWASCLVLRLSELFKSCDYLLKKEWAWERRVKEVPVPSAYK